MNFTASTKKLITVLTALLLAVLLAASMNVLGSPVSAEETDYTNWHEAVTVANSQFDEVGSETVPLPTDWTGSPIGSAPSTGVVAGVMDLDTYSSSKDNYKLEQYPEYKSKKPDSPFGNSSSEFDETNRNVLLINANGIETAYGFTSAEISLSADSFYKLTVWTKTGGHAANGGAAILVNGVTDEAEGFTAIRTDSLTGGSENNGWFEYTILFATDYDASTATVKLQLGYDKVGGRTSGYAMFDNVKLVRLNAQSYFSEVASSVAAERKLVLDTAKDVYDERFNASGEFENGVIYTTTNQHGFGTSIGNAVIKDGSHGITGYGTENAVYAPRGSVAGYNNVLVLSTYDKSTETFKSGYHGVRSEKITLKRFSYYRLSLFFYTEGITGGAANLTLEYKSVLNGGDHSSSSASLTYSSGNPGLFGWQEASMLINGSDLSDFTANVVISLGTEENVGGGSLFVDGVRLIEISSAEYDELSESADATVALDTATDDSGISNGRLNTVGTSNDIHDYSLDTPLVPANWTMKNTAQVGTTNYASTTVSTDDAVYGLVRVEDLSFISGLDKYYGNALKLASETATAFCYASESVTLSADSYNTVAIKLFADGLDGYGANLVLKRDSKVIGTIEQIKKSGTYTFYVKNGSADSSVIVELWLGLNDRTDNTSKLASGAVYFTDVTLKTDSTQEIFDAKAESYKYNRTNAQIRAGISYAAIDLTDNFTLFDSYTEGSVKVPYNWSHVSGSGSKVVYGIFDATNREGDSTVPSSFDNKGKQYAVMLQNVTPTYSTLTLDNAFTFTADSYYKLSVSVKTAIPADYAESETAVGASVYLSTSDNKFVFTDTSETVDQITDKEAFKTFTFYIKGGDADTTANLVLGLGGSARSNQYCIGRLYLNDITIEDLSNLDYDELVADLDDDEYIIDTYSMRVDYSTAEDETEDDEETTEGDSSLEWWLVPSILLAVAIVIAVVGTIIRKAIEKRPTRPGKTPSRAAYDRRSAHTSSSPAAPKANSDNDSFEDFDDTKPADKATELDAEEPLSNSSQSDASDEAHDDTDEAADEDTQSVDVTEGEAETVEAAAETEEEAKPDEAKADETEASEDTSDNE